MPVHHLAPAARKRDSTVSLLSLFLQPYSLSSRLAINFARTLAPLLSDQVRIRMGVWKKQARTILVALLIENTWQTLANGVQPWLSLVLGLMPSFLRSSFTTVTLPSLLALESGVCPSLSGRLMSISFRLSKSSYSFYAKNAPHGERHDLSYPVG